MSRAVVMGLGRFGGGLGAVRAMAERYERVLVTDLGTEESLAPALARLRGLIESGRVETRLGAHDPADLDDAELLVVNPAVPRPWDNAFVSAARDRGIAITTEIGLVFDALPQGVRTVGVTGSAGKSTTSAMIHAGLASAGVRARLGGNIGGSLLSEIATLADADAVVLELSSAMLWWLGQREPLPRIDVGVLTTFSPNHLDWHATIEHYRQSKQVLARATTITLVDDIGEGWPTSAQRVTPEPFAGELLVPGEHNRRNAGAAIAACKALGVDGSPGISAFGGLPHRLCAVHASRGVRFVDDSKSTTPGATRLAIEATGGSPTRLILGGYDKGVDLSEMIDAARAAERVYAIGATGRTIASGVGASAVFCETLERAMQRIAGDARAGETVLLSPGCASWDQFENYESRGHAFAHLARELFGGDP